jgi:ubiquitin thioesterase OTU1
MKARYKGPAGTGIITLPDDATVKAVFEELKAKTGIAEFTIKFGPPMSMRNVDISYGDADAKSLGLNGETLTIAPREARSIAPVQPAGEMRHPSRRHDGTSSGSAQSPEDVTVPWPEREGTVCEFRCNYD